MVDYKIRDLTLGPFFKQSRLGGLKVKIDGGHLDVANNLIDVEPKQFDLTPSSTNYIFIDWTTNEITVNTTGFTDRCKPLWELVTDADSITTPEGEGDKRAIPRVSAHSCYASHDVELVDETTNIDIDWGLIDLTTVSGLVIPKNACTVKMNIAAQDSGAIGAGVYVSVREPGDTLLTHEFRIYPQVGGIWLGVPAVEVGLDMNSRFERKVKVSGTFKWKAFLCGWGFGK